MMPLAFRPVRGPDLVHLDQPSSLSLRFWCGLRLECWHAGMLAAHGVRE